MQINENHSSYFIVGKSCGQKISLFKQNLSFLFIWDLTGAIKGQTLKLKATFTTAFIFKTIDFC